MTKYLVLTFFIVAFLPFVGSAATYNLPPSPYTTEADKALVDAAGNLFLALFLAPIAAFVMGSGLLYTIRKIVPGARKQGSLARLAAVVIVALGAGGAGYITFFAILSRPM